MPEQSSNFGQLVKDVYSQAGVNYTPSDNDINEINNQYKGDYKSFLTDFYKQAGVNYQLTDDDFNNIDKQYGFSSVNQQPVEQTQPTEQQPTYIQQQLMDKGLLPKEGTPEGYSPLNETQQSKPVEPVVQENLSNEKPKEEQSFIGKLAGTVGNEFMTGLNSVNSWIADVPGFIYDLAGSPFRAVGLEVPTSKDFKGTALTQVSDYYKNQSKAYEEKTKQINPEREKGITQAFQNGDIKDGIVNLAGSISQSLPASLAMIMSGGETLPTILGSSLVFGAGKAQEIDQTKPEMNYDAGRIVAALNGTLEGVFETYLGSGAVAKSLSNVIKKEGEEAAKDQVKKSLRQVFVNMLTENPWLAPLGEGFEEVGTQLAQNAVDKYSGYKPDLKITDGVGDSFLAGAGMGGIHGAVIGLAKTAMKEKGIDPEQTDQPEQQPLNTDGPQFTVDPRSQFEAQTRQNIEPFKDIDSGNLKVTNIQTPNGQENVQAFVVKEVPGVYDQEGRELVAPGYVVDMGDGNRMIKGKHEIGQIEDITEDDYISQQLSQWDADQQNQELIKQNMINVDGKQFVLTGQQNDKGYEAIVPESGESIVIPASTVEKAKGTYQQTGQNANVVQRVYGRTNIQGVQDENGNIQVSEPATVDQANNLKEEVERETNGKSTVIAQEIPNEDTTAPVQYQLSIVPNNAQGTENQRAEAEPPVSGSEQASEPVNPEIQAQVEQKTAPSYKLNGQDIDQTTAKARVKAAILKGNKEKLSGLEINNDPELSALIEKAFPKPKAKFSIGKKTISPEDAMDWIIAADNYDELNELKAENIESEPSIAEAYQAKVKQFTPTQISENEKPVEQAQPESNIAGQGTGQGEVTTQEEQGQGINEGLEENVNESTVANVMAADYLFTGGVGVLSSSDYLVKSLSGAFTKASGLIEQIRQKYSKEINDNNLGYIKDFVNTELYNRMMADIRNAINTSYNNNQEVIDIFDQILQYPTGLPVKLGTQLSIQLESINDNAVPPVVGESFTPGDSAPLIDETTKTENTIDQAAAEVNTNPTEAQKEAGNYKKGHVTIQGMDITIENPKGSFRSGIDEDGKAWETEMKSHYGYFKRTNGKDGDQIDVFIGDNPESNTVFVVDQNAPKTGAFDESKVMLGYNTADEAKAAYMANYEPEWNGFGSITPVSVDEFKTWLYDGAKQRKPFAEYKDTPAPIEEQNTTDVSLESNQVQDVAGQESGQRPAVKEPWQMTRDEYTKSVGANGYWAETSAISDHNAAVRNALFEGKQVPEEVLNDYPELKPVVQENLNTEKPRSLEQVLSEGKKEVQEKKQFTPLPEEKPASNYGKNNKIFTEDAAAAARERLRQKRNNLNSGLDFSAMSDVAILAGYHIESGIRKFSDFVKAMVDDIGPEYKDYLKGSYENIRRWPGMETIAKEMDSTNDVDAANIDELLKQSNELNVQSDKNNDNVSDKPSNSQSNSPDSNNEVPGNENNVPDERRSSGRSGNENQGNGKQSGRGRSGRKGGSGLFADLFGEQSDNEVYQPEQGSESKNDDAGDFDGRGSRIDGSEGLHAEQGANDENYRDSEKPAGSFAANLKVKLEQQKQAESIPVKIQDENNIRETLPFLLPEQQDDVLKAETRFFDPSHQTKEKAFGKGMLFTNGTGTGKTYTGLGIAKRFHKSGKQNILILTPSQPKVNDWATDGKNVGLEIEPLPDTSTGGTGPVVTTYANFRDNSELKKREFDLILYDESHRLMEEKNGATSATTATHYQIGNKDEYHALSRLQEVHPLWIEEKRILDALDRLPKDPTNDMMQEQYQEVAERTMKLSQQLENVREQQRNVLPGLREQAKEAVKRTKVVFLSATPFKGHFNLRYANGFLFNWGDEITYQGHSRVNPEARFFLDNFGSAYEWKFHRLQTKQNASADAIAMQEVQFAEKLMKDGVVSGRTINSEMDYGREFPRVIGLNTDEINKAFSEIFNYQTREFDGLMEAARGVFYNYNYTTQLFESLKTSMSISRIQKHLDLGRKVVVFHRRKQANVAPPFRTILDTTKADANYKINNPESQEKDREEGYKMLTQVDRFEQKYSGLLDYEQTLNYNSAIDQISAAFGEKAVYINGDVSKKDKANAIKQFNTDDSGKDIIVVQEESGKEGISLHDTTGKHQRVLMSMSMPISSITALQIEGRIYRIGQESDAIFEYPLLGLDMEIEHFGRNINRKLSTTENLAVGDQSRDLIRSFAEGVLFSSDTVDPSLEQGKGGKAYDRKAQQNLSDFRKAILVYQSNQKIRGRRDEREGVDYFPTPEPIGEKMVEWLNLKPVDTAMEPSAGHGAIAMWFPNFANVTAIEPSFNLYSKLNARAGGGDRKVINSTFEEHHIVNKYNGIAMNPPFGTGGKMAMDHVEKAFHHLKDGGRLVAIIPDGPSMEKRLDNFLYGEDEKGKALNPEAYLIADIKLPGFTFEQAGTAVNGRIVVIERHISAPESMNDGYRYDLRETKNINDLFDTIENISIPENKRANVEKPTFIDLVNAVQAPINAKVESKEHPGFEVFEQKDTRDGNTLYMTSPVNLLDRDEYKRTEAIAKRNGGYYSSYQNKASNVRKGFLFKTEEARTNFLNEVTGNSKPQFRIIGETGAANLDKAEEATTRLDNLAIAREMEQAVKDVKSIRRATGWEKGVDGKWRYEVPDSELSENYREAETLEQAVNDPELFKAYPELKEIKIGALSAEEEENSGSFWKEGVDGKPTIYAGGVDKVNLKSVLAHEIQHAIQEIEGFAQGGNTSVESLITHIVAERRKLNRELYELSTTGKYNTEEYANKKKRRDELIQQEWEIENPNTDVSLQMYRRLAGEVESRNVQTRMNMTPEERLNTLLSETEDVSREDQIVLMDGLGVSNLESNSNEHADFISQLEGSAKFNSPVHLFTPEKAGRFFDGRAGDEILDQIKAGGWAGFTLYGKVIINPNENKSLFEVAKTWIHEKAHIQIRKVMPKESTQIAYFERMYDLIGQAELNRVLGNAYDDIAKYAKAVEYYCHLAEEAAYKGSISGNVPEIVKKNIFEIVNSITNKNLRDEINNYQASAVGNNKQVESNTGRKETTDQGGQGRNTLDTGDSGPLSESSNGHRTVGKTVPLAQFLKKAKETVSEKNSSLPEGVLTEKEFNKKYFGQHKDIRSGSKEKALESFKKIQESGFNPGAYIIPIYKGGEPSTIIEKNYGPRKGDMIYLVPKAWIKTHKYNPDTIKEGWKPTSDEFVEIEYDNQSAYEAYLNNIKRKSENISDNNNILFKKSKDRLNLDGKLGEAARQYKEKQATKQNFEQTTEKVRESMQDYDLPIRRLEEEIKRRGGKLTDKMKPYRDKSLSYGRTETLFKEFSREKFDPVLNTINAIKKTGMPGEAILPYVIAKHATERNSYMREQELNQWMEANQEATPEEVQAKREELAKKDYSGVRGFDPENKWENPDELAQAIADEFEDQVPVGLVDDLWSNIKNTTSSIVDYWKEGNQVSEQQASDIKDRFKYFVPLRGWREGAAKELVYSKGQGFGASMKHAEGRKSLADNPLAYIEQVAFKAIGEQTDNEFKTSFLHMVANNYGDDFKDLYELRRAYYVKHTLADGTEEWEITLDRPSEQMFKDGNAKVKIYDQYQKLRTPAQSQEHEIVIRRPSGDMVVVMKDKYLPVAQAMNSNNFMARYIFGNGVFDANFYNKPLVKWFGGANNWLKAMYTSFNVVFPFTNFMRDASEASITQWIKGEHGEQVVANYRKSFPAIAIDLLGKQDKDGKYDQMLREFRETGGNTGYTHSQTLEEIEKEINKKLSVLERKGKMSSVKDAFTHILKPIEAWNQLFEDATRFSVYITARENGKTAKEAAIEAKEASVNFNRKGKLSKSFDAIWAFWNVGIQSAQKNLSLAKRYPKRFAIAAGSFVALGFIEAMINAAMPGDDDDDYYGISSYVRENYLIIPNVIEWMNTGKKGNKYLRVPLPQFWRGFKSIGSLAFDVLNGKIDPLSATGKGVMNFIASLSPVDVAGFWQDGEFSIAPIIPTIGKPVYEAETNKNYMGYTVYKEPFTKEQKKILADSGLGKNNVNPAIKFFTDALFRMGGGDNATKYYEKNGDIKKVPGVLDVNPSYIEHLITGYTGGTGGVLSDAMTTAFQAIKPDQEVDFKNVPFVNAFLKKVPEKKWAIIEQYYKLKDEQLPYSGLKREYFNKSDKSQYINIATDGYSNEYNAVLDAYDKKLQMQMEFMDYKTAEGNEAVINTMQDAINAINEVKQKYNKK